MTQRPRKATKKGDGGNFRPTVSTLRHNLTGKLSPSPFPLGDVPDTEADVSDLIANVGYRPMISVEQGVAEFVQWYRGYYCA